MPQPKLSLDELNELWGKTLVALRSNGVEEIIVDRQYYHCFWPVDAWQIENPNPIIGDILDDLSDLRNEAKSSPDERSGWHMAHHLTGVLTLLCAQAMGDEAESA